MDINQLHGFREICRYGSMTKAARVLYQSPQGLSRMVKNLEEELDTVLLYRSAAGVELTDSGRCLLEYAESVLEGYKKMQRELQLIRENQLGEVNLLSAYGILRLVKPESLLEFRKKFPEIRFRYHEYPDFMVERLFDQKEGNVAFSIGPFQGDKYEVTKLASFPISLIVNRNHPLAERKQVSIRELKEESFYLEGEEFKIYYIIREACLEHGFEPRIVFQTSGFSLCRSVVSRGSGISFVVDHIYQEMESRDVVKIPLEENLRWNVCMLTRSREPVNEAVQQFEKFIKNCLIS